MRNRNDDDRSPVPFERRTYGREWSIAPYGYSRGPVFEPDFYGGPNDRGSYGTDMSHPTRDLRWEMDRELGSPREFGKDAVGRDNYSNDNKNDR